MNKKTLSTLGALAVAVSSLVAPVVRADVPVVDCAAKTVSRVKVRGTGTVWVTFDNQNSWWEMCKVGAPEAYKGVTSAACEGMLSLLTAAQLSGRQVSVTVEGSSQSACVAGAAIYQVQVL